MKLVKYPNNHLAQKCEEVKDFKQLDTIVQRMLAVCKNKKRPGVGLAAPQIGKNIRLMLMWYNKKLRVFVNPELRAVSVDESIGKESCLSFSKVVSYPIGRSSQIVLKWQNLTGEEKEDTFEGYEARIIQHELDHLNGITMFDRWEMQK